MLWEKISCCRRNNLQYDLLTAWNHHTRCHRRSAWGAASWSTRYSSQSILVRDNTLGSASSTPVTAHRAHSSTKSNAKGYWSSQCGDHTSSDRPCFTYIHKQPPPGKNKWYISGALVQHAPTCHPERKIPQEKTIQLLQNIITKKHNFYKPGGNNDSGNNDNWLDWVYYPF